MSTLTPGHRLGPYEIVAPIGAGGMGEVFRARDTRLQRDVAIKVLPREFARDEQLKARFAREAKAISALAHPHICVLHDVGSDDGVEYLVMELVQGETLADRLKRGALRLDEALRCAADVAGAMAHAHEAGITHRDLKPGNIMITKSGAKVLDFGLAKFSSALETTIIPGAKPLTEEGTVLGTLQYMAPEQIEGRETDARSDIFAFGAVLYEMVTGRRAFEGSSRISLIAAILESDPPPIMTIQPMTPASLDRIVRICLAKDPDERFQSARDVALQLQWIARERSGAGATPAESTPRRRRANTAAWIIAALSLAAAAAAGIVAWRATHAAKPRFVRRLAVPYDESAPIALSAEIFAVSPDGKSIVYAGKSQGSATDAAPAQLFLRRLDGTAAKPIAGTDDAASPFFSSDGEWIAFGSEHKLKKVSLSTGTVLTICNAQLLRGGAWGANDNIIFAADATSPLSLVPASGGTPAPITQLDARSGEYSHRLPELLPGGKTLLFSAVSRDGVWIDALDLASGKRRRIMPGVRGRYDGAGHLVVASDGILRAFAFDPSSLRISGEPVDVADSVNASTQYGFAHYAVLPDGAVIYLSQHRIASQIVVFDRSGKATPMPAAARPFSSPHYSPDGTRVILDDGRANLWLCDVNRVVCTQATDDEQATRPIWSHDGAHVVFRCGAKTQSNLCEAPAANLAERKKLMEWTKPWPLEGPYAMTSDERDIIFGVQESRRSWDLWVAHRDGTSAPLIAAGNVNENDSAFSPDGAWLAYSINYTDVVVQHYPPDARKWIVSRQPGAWSPVWRGNEIFYASGKQMMAVHAAAGSFDAPRLLFTTDATISDFDVSPDGQHFVTTVPLTKQPAVRFNIVEGALDALTARR